MNNNKLHIPTVLVVSILTVVFVAGGIVYSVRAGNKTMEKQGDKIECNEAELKDHGERLKGLETAFNYIQTNVDDIKVVQSKILEEVMKLNGTH